MDAIEQARKDAEAVRQSALAAVAKARAEIEARVMAVKAAKSVFTPAPS